MKRSIAILILISLGAAACGSESELTFDASVATQTYPMVNRVSPATAKAGDSVTVFGIGFSITPQLNVILVGGKQAIASSYAVVSPATATEVESLTFTMPTGVSTGSQAVMVTVVDNPSNTTITLSITP